MHFMMPNLLGATGSVTSCVSQLRPGGTLVVETPSGTDAPFIKNYPPNIHHHRKRPESTVDLSTADFSKYDTIPATALTVLGKPKQAPGGKAPWFLHSNQQCKVSKCNCPLKQRLTTNVELFNTAISQSNAYFLLKTDCYQWTMWCMPLFPWFDPVCLQQMYTTYRYITTEE